ncbi:MAG: alpha/beta fold hydrolase [Candidatus Nanopelagicaceae bacterium]|nr:alpha/beta fold hydrolase [Candidatus Nanopelagicaceae bacterium]
MAEPIRPSTVLPANRTAFTLRTADGQTLVGEVASPIANSTGAILCLHPLPTAGGMMDSHIYKKAANRLPDMAGITVVRFNTRGTTSANGTSTGTFDNGSAEQFDVEAALKYSLDELKLENLWVVGWSFGTDLALRHAKDARIKGLILLSPPLRTSQESDLEYWNLDGRPVITVVPELDDYLQPPEAAVRFAVIRNHTMIAVEGAKHLWVGEPAVHRVLSEITKIVAPDRLPLPTEI